MRYDLQIGPAATAGGSRNSRWEIPTVTNFLSPKARGRSQRSHWSHGVYLRPVHAVKTGECKTRVKTLQKFVTLTVAPRVHRAITHTKNWHAFKTSAVAAAWVSKATRKTELSHSISHLSLYHSGSPRRLGLLWPGGGGSGVYHSPTPEDGSSQTNSQILSYRLT